MATGDGSSNVTDRSCAAALIATPQSRAHQSALRIQSSELWVANASGPPSPFGGGGVGLKQGEGGSGKRERWISTCSGVAIASTAGRGAGTDGDRTGPPTTIIETQKDETSAGTPPRAGRMGAKEGRG